MEAQRQVVDVAENLAREPARRILPDLLEQGVAKIVGKNPGEARRRISGNQRSDDAEGYRRTGHSVDDRLVGEGHGQNDGLPGKDQQDRGDDPGLQLGFALGPEHREEAEQRLHSAPPLIFLFRRHRHACLGRFPNDDPQTTCAKQLEPRRPSPVLR